MSHMGGQSYSTAEVRLPESPLRNISKFNLRNMQAPGHSLLLKGKIFLTKRLYSFYLLLKGRNVCNGGDFFKKGHDILLLALPSPHPQNYFVLVEDKMCS